MPLLRRQPLKVGTDFTGLNSPLLALWGLQIPVTHVFACDNEPAVMRFLMAVMKPKLMLDDIRHRCVESMPKVDYFHFSPPCISFSSQGCRPGADDPRDLLFDYSLSYIKIHTPKLVTLEQASTTFIAIHRPEQVSQAMQQCDAFEPETQLILHGNPHHHAVKISP